MTWAKFMVVGHKCDLLVVWGVRVFYCSTITTARAFQSYWGGRIEREG